MLPNVLIQWQIRYGNRFVRAISDVALNWIVCECLNDLLVKIVVILAAASGRLTFGCALITVLRQCQLMYTRRIRRAMQTTGKPRTSNHCTNHRLLFAVGFCVFVHLFAFQKIQLFSCR